MKKLVSLALALSLSSPLLLAETSWENPAVLCPEELLPRGLNCPDLSNVENPYTDFPSDMTKEMILEWRNNKSADLKLCRNKEVLRRENIKPGSFTPNTIELAWMAVNSGENVKEKLTAILDASSKYGIPPQVLIGAMKQESLMASIGISPDGGNFSCGISQLNIQEWCQSMNNLSNDEKMKYGWPLEIECSPDVLPTDIVKPFYDIAFKNLGARAKYQLTSDDFRGISQDQVQGSFPSGNRGLQSKRFSAVNSFVNNCQDVSLSIKFKAETLKSLFDEFVPEKLKMAEMYSPGDTFQRACQNVYTSKYYPLHTGWLLAVAMYNAGPVEAKLVGHYYQAKSTNLPDMSPLDLIEALHWGGKYKKGTDNITFTNMDGDRPVSRRWFFFKKEGNKLTQSWFKSCIVQRHVAKVIQHVTLPAESIAKSLEQAPCTTSGVPEYRQTSSGIKE
ncbi:MAG: hypothetical protein KBD76_01260 [Bacteriovorax sp.]|jgi:hypothetical protein|nr:hypothetical protein [Bacteriovorax sp.]